MAAQVKAKAVRSQVCQRSKPETPTAAQIAKSIGAPLKHWRQEPHLPECCETDPKQQDGADSAKFKPGLQEDVMGMPAWPQRVGRLAPCFRIDRNVHVKGTRAAISMPVIGRSETLSAMYFQM